MSAHISRAPVRVAIAVVSLLVFPGTGKSVNAAPSAGSALGNAAVLTIRNTQWDALQVELRIGLSSTCDQNESVAIKTLRRNQAWGVVSDQTICWRREQTPGDASAGWTLWAQTRLALDEVRDVTL